ncbi:hypothetical protein [Streptomyces albidoflavus]|uniref:hypothetical protein n=1 Tax=Streptomyces albidoflavus TaxID=1886 RepID=UPI001F5C7098|nr:hypothetical protein [Streptomyces albidoflavus]
MPASDVLAHPSHTEHPTGPSEINLAVLDSITSMHRPEMFLWINRRRPDGSVKIWYAWTEGGEPLGNRVDELALTRGLDAADWLHIADLHQRTSVRGHFETWAYPLRPVLAEVQGTERAPESRRDGLRRLLVKAGEVTGTSPRTTAPRWLGFGPHLVLHK